MICHMQSENPALYEYVEWTFIHVFNQLTASTQTYITSFPLAFPRWLEKHWYALDRQMKQVRLISMLHFSFFTVT